MKTILEIPDSAKKVIEEYQNLHLGGKKIVTPYFMNLRKQKAGLRVFVGKGDPGELNREVEVVAKLKGLDLEKATPDQIREFMMKNNLGIDCSGFVYYVINYWLLMQGDKKLRNYLKFYNNSLFARLKRKLRPVENIGAELMTNELNCDLVTDLNDIKPGDLLRSKGKQKNSHHVSLINKVILEKDKVVEFEYVHSMRYYEDQCGIRFGTVKITKPGAELKDQQWLEVLNDRNYTYEGLMNNYQDNGIRRLKRVDLNYVSNKASG